MSAEASISELRAILQRLLEETGQAALSVRGKLPDLEAGIEGIALGLSDKGRQVEAKMVRLIQGVLAIDTQSRLLVGALLALDALDSELKTVDLQPGQPPELRLAFSRRPADATLAAELTQWTIKSEPDENVVYVIPERPSGVPFQTVPLRTEAGISFQAEVVRRGKAVADSVGISDVVYIDIHRVVGGPA